MQTFVQTFAGNQTWVLNVPGKYFTTLQCTNPINVRFYLGGKQLDLGQISQLLAGLEVTLGDIADTRAAFDRVELDITGPDTVAVGIGNGQARYNRSQGTVQVVGTVPVSGPLTDAQLRASVVDVRERPEAPTGFLSSTGSIAANTPITLVSPAANTNGVIFQFAACSDLNATTIEMVFLHKASAPTTIYDGTPLCVSDIVGLTTTQYAMNGRLETPAFVPAGQGIYYITGAAGTSLNRRHARWRVL